VLKTLASQGYRLEVVHPEADEIGGHPCHRSVGELAGKVGGLVVVLPPAETEKVVREAAEAGIAHLWLQQGAASEEAVRLCREQGLNVVHGECILMFARPTGIHKVHRWLWGVLGKLPRDEG
jgi:predicted CoA-binding protein